MILFMQANCMTASITSCVMGNSVQSSDMNTLQELFGDKPAVCRHKAKPLLFCKAGRAA